MKQTFITAVTLLLSVCAFAQTAQRSDGASLTPDGDKLEVTITVSKAKGTTLFAEFTLDQLPMTITAGATTITVEGKRGEYKVNGKPFAKSSDAKKEVRDLLRKIYPVQ